MKCPDVSALIQRCGQLVKAPLSHYRNRVFNEFSIFEITCLLGGLDKGMFIFHISCVGRGFSFPKYGLY